MSDTTERIHRYYSPDAEKEWRRLDELGTGPIEFELTTRQLRRHLMPRIRACWMLEAGRDGMPSGSHPTATE